MPLLKNSHLVPRSEDVKLNSFEFRRNDVAPSGWVRQLWIEVPMGGESIPGLPHAANGLAGRCCFTDTRIWESMLAREVQIFRSELMNSIVLCGLVNETPLISKRS